MLTHVETPCLLGMSTDDQSKYHHYVYSDMYVGIYDTDSSILNKINGTFIMGRVPIIYFYYANSLSYYNVSKQYLHYIVVTEVNMTNGTITLMDPHYDSNYHGKHTVTLSNFYSALKKGGYILGI
jgi:hypothetical protein